MTTIFPQEKLLAMDERFLNLTADNQTGLEKTHLPHGLPAHPSSDPLFVLYQDDYVLGYSAEYLMPRWAAFSAGPDAVTLLFCVEFPVCSKWIHCVGANLQAQNNSQGFAWCLLIFPSPCMLAPTPAAPRQTAWCKDWYQALGGPQRPSDSKLSHSDPSLHPFTSSLD